MLSFEVNKDVYINVMYCVSYTMSKVAAWSILTGASFIEVLVEHPDNLDLILQADDG